MVVDDIQDHGDTELMCPVDETAKVVWATVESRRCEQVDAVVAPSETAGEIRHGHQLDAGNPELGERRQLLRGGRPAPFRSEAADVHLIDDKALARQPGPAFVAPGKILRIDNLGPAVRTIRLEA